MKDSQKQTVETGELIRRLVAEQRATMEELIAVYKHDSNALGVIQKREDELRALKAQLRELRTEKRTLSSENRALASENKDHRKNLAQSAISIERLQRLERSRVVRLQRRYWKWRRALISRFSRGRLDES